MTPQFCLALLALAPAAAVAAPCALGPSAETVAVERAVDGDTIELDDGRLLRLAGVAAPKAPLGRQAADWPLEAASREALERAAVGKVMELRLSPRSPDRHGRLVGWLAGLGDEDHAGVATDLLAYGLLRVSADAAGRDCGATLGAAEARAIGARLGLWSDPYYGIRDASDGAALAAEKGRFVVAEGRVASVRTSAGRAYVNFGARWREALSLTLSEGTLKRLGGFAGLGIGSGIRVRARGVVEARLGPTIDVTEAAQIERLDGRTR